MRQILWYIIFLLSIFSCNGISDTHTATNKKEYPTQAVRIIEPFGAGGGPDIVAKIISQKLSEVWRQPVTVENHTGGGSTIAPALVAKSPPDGYTLLINTSAQAYSATVSNDLPYDPLKDFIPVASLTSQPYVLVTGRRSGFKTIKELIAASKKNELKFGSTGLGTGTHLGLEKFNLAAGIKARHVPAQQGESIKEVIVNTIEHRFTYIMAPIQLAMKDIQNGSLVALGVTTKQRSNLLPNVPTIDESGISGFDFPIWYGIWAPASTPDNIVDKLSKDINNILVLPDLRDSLTKHGAHVLRMTQPEFAKFVLSENETALKTLKPAGLKD